MSDFDPYLPFFGTWSGTKQVFFGEGSEPVSSEVSLWAESGAGGAALLVEYDWTYEENPVGGTLLAIVNEDLEASGGWADGFHMSNSVMSLAGHAEKDGRILLKGTYSAGEGPEWGWRIELTPPEGEKMVLQMFNIMPGPDGGEELAVRMELTREPDEE
ncbi:MAG: DUF1579 family protein [Verrucomicrobia bacterium]|nr:DUF1579 family protein [Verrucomicrobiota bacterium]